MFSFSYTIFSNSFSLLWVLMPPNKKVSVLPYRNVHSQRDKKDKPSVCPLSFSRTAWAYATFLKIYAVRGANYKKRKSLSPFPSHFCLHFNTLIEGLTPYSLLVLIHSFRDCAKYVRHIYHRGRPENRRTRKFTSYLLACPKRKVQWNFWLVSFFYFLILQIFCHFFSSLYRSVLNGRWTRHSLQEASGEGRRT